MTLIKDSLAVIATVIAVGGVIYTWLTSGSKNNSIELEKLDQSLGQVETRLTKIEADMKHLPDEKSLMAVKLDMAEMKGTFGRIEANIAGITGTVHRVEEYLLRKGIE